MGYFTEISSSEISDLKLNKIYIKMVLKKSHLIGLVYQIIYDKLQWIKSASVYKLKSTVDA